MAAGEVSPLMRQYRRQLSGLERLQRAGAQDHRRMPASNAVGNRLGVLHEHGAQGRLGAADEPRGLARAVSACCPAARRWVIAVSTVRAATAPARVRPEPGDGGTARRAVGLAQPQHAGSDQVAEPATEGSCVDRERQAGQPERGDDRPSGG